MRGAVPVSRQSTLSSIEVPYTNETYTTTDNHSMIASELETASESSRSSNNVRASSRQPRHSLHHAGESADTHTHFDAGAASEPGISLYRYEELQAVLNAANASETVEARREANQVVMEKLANLGVSVFLISYECDDVWREIKHCIFEASNMALWNCSPDRCLLYEDEKGRIFNILVAGDFSGLKGTYDAMLDTASGAEALCAIVVLLRAFACSGT